MDIEEIGFVSGLSRAVTVASVTIVFMPTEKSKVQLIRLFNSFTAL